jgi:hypothetical protein
MVVGTSKSRQQEPTERPNLGSPQTTTTKSIETIASTAAAKESLSPHTRSSTRDRSNSLRRKKSTLRTAAEQPSPLCYKATTVLFVVPVIDTNKDAGDSATPACLYG